MAMLAVVEVTMVVGMVVVVADRTCMFIHKPHGIRDNARAVVHSSNSEAMTNGVGTLPCQHSTAS